MNRGSRASSHCPLVLSQCFNEAPIHESGKFEGFVTQALERATGFNEAPIHESGK